MAEGSVFRRATAQLQENSITPAFQEGKAHLRKVIDRLRFILGALDNRVAIFI